MAAWVLVPCLYALRAEVNTLAPNRDKRSDGTIGDARHQKHVSDHNDDEIGKVPVKDADNVHEVHALDLDADLREPGLTMGTVIAFIVDRCRTGEEKRLTNIIWDRTIWSADNGWKPRVYKGDNPHTEHAHLSASYNTRYEASTASWHLEDIPVALTEADKKWISAQLETAAKEAAEQVWAHKVNIERGVGKKANLARMDAIISNVPVEHGGIRQAVDAIAPPAPPA